MLTCPQCQAYAGVPVRVDDAIADIRVAFTCYECLYRWTALYTLKTAQILKEEYAVCQPFTP